MERLFWICLAGALGTGARYGIGLWAGARFGHSFPYGTLAVNVAGCFLAALVLQLAASTTAFPANLRLGLATGFCGGLTTYSSFNYEATKLLESSAIGTGLWYFALTTGACFAAGLLGFVVATRLVS